MGKALHNEFARIIPIIVPIFDGVRAMSPCMKTFMHSNFPGVIDEFDAPDGPEVRAISTLWWYCGEEAASKAGHLNENDGLLYFYLTPIIKRSNRRKHNSHQWFFYGIVNGLGQYATYSFLTDCGTSYEKDCISHMVRELFFKDDLIGVTGRQRVCWPSQHFHPCEQSAIPFLRGNHAMTGPSPCWKCYVTYICSPCPLQGFEYEASAIVTSAMYNLVECLPVMPGPCQLLNWQKMNKYKVVDGKILCIYYFTFSVLYTYVYMYTLYTCIYLYMYIYIH